MVSKLKWNKKEKKNINNSKMFYYKKCLIKINKLINKETNKIKNDIEK